VVRREWREVARDHVLHPAHGDLFHLGHVLRHAAARALGDECDEQLGLVEEVNLREPLGVVDAHVAVRFEGGAYEAGEHIELLLRMRHAHEVGLLLDVPG